MDGSRKKIILSEETQTQKDKHSMNLINVGCKANDNQAPINSPKEDR